MFDGCDYLDRRLILAKPTATGNFLDRRQLNRALLARQMLLAREQVGVAETVERLVGLQAQVPANPYLALWTRLEGFDPLVLSELIATRRAVRISLQRSTVHLVTAGDCLVLRPVLQSVQERSFYTGSPYGRQLEGMDLETLVAVGRELLEEKPRTLNALGKLLLERWPERDATAMSYAVRNLVPLVQVPPRGLWHGSGAATCTTAEHWLGRPLSEDALPDPLVDRFLAAFGPASARDMQTWSGLQSLGEAFERARPRLRTYRDEAGRELFDLPDAPLPDPDLPAPVRFLPEYDNVFLSHADRSRIVSEGNRKRMSFANGYGATFLLDGFIAGGWKLVREGEGVVLQAEAFEPMSVLTQEELHVEGEALLRFLASGAASYEVRLTLPA